MYQCFKTIQDFPKIFKVSPGIPSAFQRMIAAFKNRSCFLRISSGRFQHQLFVQIRIRRPGNKGAVSRRYNPLPET